MRPGSTAVLTVAIACSALAQTYTIKTFAGGALPENLPGLSASLGGINGMAVDAAGNVYLSLGDYDIVVRCDVNTGALTRIAGTGMAGFSGDNGPATSAQVANPTGIVIDSAGNLYIADTDNNRIRMVANGNITTIAGNGAQGYAGDNGPAANAQFNGLGALALDSAGNLYAADFYNQVVRKIANGIITTVAGNGTYGYTGDKGPATSAQLAGPSGIAVDYNGNLYIAEGYNNCVRRVSNDVITTLVGTGTAGFFGDYGAPAAALLREPTDVTIDSLSNLYIADYGNNRIRMVTYSNPKISTFAGDGQPVYNGEHILATSASLLSPQRVAADASGNLFIVDGSRVRKVSHSMITTMAGGGTPSGENGPAASAQLLWPQGVALDGGGNVYISDSGTGRVLKVAGSTLTRVAGTGTVQGTQKDNMPATGALIGAPESVAVNAAGELYIADSQNLRVWKVSNGIISTMAGGGPSLGDNGPPAKAKLSYPQAVTVDAGGKLYLADLNRIRMISNGVITTVAGNGSAGYQGDAGVATAAELSNPTGVAVDNAGNFYLADYGNNRVRMVANGTITTVAGNGTYGFNGNGVTATSAQIGYPTGVAADSSGNLYITDTYRVLKVTKGKISTIGGLQNPQGIAVDASGNVYVAEPATHRVRVLSPSTTPCTFSSTPTAPQALAAGGTLNIAVQTAAACSWVVENLPAWITVPGSSFGAGPDSVILAIASNPDPPRSAAILIGGQSVTVAQGGAMTITGTITLSPAKAVPGVTVTLSGSKSSVATSDSGGNFSFSGFSSTGTYTVTPSLSGYTFVPASQTFTNATANPTANFTAWPLPQIGGVGPVFGSTLQTAPAGFAARETISIYGANLCSDAATAAPTLPDRLAACIVQVDGVNLRLYFASPAQINAVLPQTLALGTHQLTVQRYTDTGYKTLAAQGSPFSLAVNRVSMAFAERADGGAQVLMAQNTDGSLIGSAKPVHPGTAIVLYLTGLGKTAQAFAEGAASKTASPATEPIQVLIEGVAAQVIYAGLQPQYPGIDQLNVQVPNYTLAPGQITVTIQISAPTAGQTVSYQLPAN